MWLMSIAAVVLGVAAVTMSVINLAKPTPPATTTTVTAAPPTYSPQEVAAAKEEACNASVTADGAITAAQRDFVATVGNRGSDEYETALSNWQTVLMVETQYMRLHVPAATPLEVAKARLISTSTRLSRLVMPTPARCRTKRPLQAPAHSA